MDARSGKQNNGMLVLCLTKALLHTRRRRWGMVVFTSHASAHNRRVYDDQLAAFIKVIFGTQLVPRDSRFGSGCQAITSRGTTCGAEMGLNSRHAVNCNVAALLSKRHEEVRSFLCSIMGSYTDFTFETHERRRHSDRRGVMYRGDIEIFEPQKRPVLMDVTLIDPAVQKHSCVGMSSKQYDDKHDRRIVPNQPGKCPARAPCGEIGESTTNGPALVSARIAELQKIEKYGNDCEQITEDAWGRPVPRGGMQFVPFAAQLSGGFGPMAEEWLSRCAKAATRLTFNLSVEQRKRAPARLIKQWHIDWAFRLPKLHLKLLVAYQFQCKNGAFRHRSTIVN